MNDYTKPETRPASDPLTETIQRNIANPERSSDFDFTSGVEEVLGEVGMSTTDSGGSLTFYGQDPIAPSVLRFGSMAAIGLAAKSVAAASVWKQRSGQGQDIHVDTRKALQRFAGFFDRKWELLDGRAPNALDTTNPFHHLPMFHETRDGRHVVALNIYPKLAKRALAFLNCDSSVKSLQQAIRQWDADDLEKAGNEAGLIFAKVRTFEEFSQEPQYSDALSRMPLISVEKIGDSDPVPFKEGAKTPLDGIRAFGMGHVIAGAGIGRDLAQYGADVLNIWRPGDSEIEVFEWDVQVGMRQTTLGDSDEDRATFERLLQDADVFFANKRPGFLESHGLGAEQLCARKPGLIHAHIALHGDSGPWKYRAGFDEVGAAVSGVFCIEGSPEHPRSPVVFPICDNVVGWLGTVGVLAALRRRAVEGGSYKVTVSLTRTVLWLMSLGIFDKDYANETAGSSDQHELVAPDLFTAKTPLGMYQGMTDQAVMSRTPPSFRTVLMPRGSGEAAWLPD
ncbi:CoA transferase [Variovorax sp. J22P240]|uniref:CoA transferase n=1 Tax=Variovorax sp. J22P240 TaxID=3053514 RepID=UPI002574EEA5|nr:CoA transferase [Variovorax sp. J22P240]MDM0001220.1 CoA transferase [Variovorax sp. J22P240]